MKSTASAVFFGYQRYFGVVAIESRISARISIEPPHQTPPMDQIERMVWLSWGLEALSDEIDTKNCFGG